VADPAQDLITDEPLHRPLEDHGPASKETLLDLWARWTAWLAKYVKNSQKVDPKKTTTEQASNRQAQPPSPLV